MFTETEIAYQTSQRLGRLATVQPNGTLQVSPVGFSDNPDTSTIDINGVNPAKSRKFRDIADNGRAALVVDEPDTEAHGLASRNRDVDQETAEQSRIGQSKSL